MPIVRIARNKPEQQTRAEELLEAARLGQEGLCMSLLQSGIDPKEAKASAKYYEYTPLIWAARDGRKELVEKGARVEDRTSGGYTALHKACVEGHHEVVEVLLQSGAEVDCKDVHGNTPLHIACYQGHLHTVTLLLRWGAKLLMNMQDLTPLDIAKIEEEAEAVKILEQWLLDHPQVGMEDRNCWQ